MGVKNLNIIVKLFQKSKKRVFHTAIIDGSNLFIVVLSRIIKSIKNKYALGLFDGVNLDVLEQFRIIISEGTYQIISMINDVISKYKLKKVLLVLDPPQTVAYNLNDKMKYNEKYKNIFFAEHSSISLSIKQEEQEKRKKNANCSDKITKDLKNIEFMMRNINETQTPDALGNIPAIENNSEKALVEDQLSDRSEVIIAKDIQVIESSERSPVEKSANDSLWRNYSLLDIYYQSTFFTIPSNLFRTISFLAHEVSKNLPPIAQIITAIDEADLVIKNLAIEEINEEKISDEKINEEKISEEKISDEKINEEKISEEISVNSGHDVIILSKDTDYYILFADSPSVYICAFNDDIYNPYYIWKNFLDTAYSYDMIVRIAPLCGNDYSGDSLILLNTSYKLIPCLCNVNNSFPRVKSERRKKVNRIFESMPVENDKLTSVEQIDDAVFNYDKNYFKLYFGSVIIYTNYQHFGRYSVVNRSPVSLSSVIKFEKVLRWKSEYLFKWKEFFENIIVVEDIEKEFEAKRTTDFIDDVYKGFTFIE
jgi:hypothetical protein